MTAGSLALGWYFMPPVDYLPKGNRNLILAIVQVPPGFNLDQIEASSPSSKGGTRRCHRSSASSQCRASITP